MDESPVSSGRTAAAPAPVRIGWVPKNTRSAATAGMRRFIDVSGFKGFKRFKVQGDEPVGSALQSANLDSRGLESRANPPCDLRRTGCVAVNADGVDLQ